MVGIPHREQEYECSTDNLEVGSTDVRSVLLLPVSILPVRQFKLEKVFQGDLGSRLQYSVGHSVPLGIL